MAVWGTDTHKLEAALELYRVHPDAPMQCFGPTLSPYLDPKEDVARLSKTSTWEDLAIEAAWPPPDEESDNAIYWLRNFAGIPAKYVGTPAIYRLINYVRLGRFRVAHQFDYDKIRETMEQYGQLLVASTQITPRRFLALYGKRDELAATKARIFEDFSEAMKHVRTAFYDPAPHHVDHFRYFGRNDQDFTVHKVGNLLIFWGTKELTNQCLILTRKNLDQLIGSTMRIANTISYFAMSQPENYLAECLAFLDWSIELAAKTSIANSYKVARAFHKARAFAQMELLENVLEESMASEKEDYIKDGLDDILRLASYRNRVKVFPPTKRVEVLHIYKWMPSPDFDATNAFAKVKSYHDNPRPSGADPDAPPKMRELWEEIKRERKLHLAYAFHRMTNRWPPTLKMHGSAPTIDDVATWEPEGVLPFYQLGKDIVSQVKDKRTVAASKLTEYDGRTDKTDGSYLLWYMKNAGLVDTKKYAEDWDSIPEDNYVRVAYKAESHKPDSRLFYMAPPIRRTMLGELEGNLARIAGYYPGSLQGKSTRDKTRMLLDIMDPWSPLKNVDLDKPTTCYIVQFDLSKFSPKSNYNVTKDYHEFWAKVFGMPHIAKMAEMGCKGDIIHTTCGLRMEYRNSGADLEGFRGRMMTMFHADLLGCACRIARERKVISGLSKLSVFIDDGACKIAAYGEGDEAKENAREFLRILQEVYAAGGQDANPSKTCVSSLGGEMLAEFYYRSTKMPTGLKAAQRLFPDYENAATTIVEEFDQLFSTSQGSVKDGADWLVTHYRYAESCLKAVNRWCRKEFRSYSPYKLALKMLTPKSYGGLGLASLQALVTTAATNLTAEGLSLLNRAARFVPQCRDDVRRIVTQPIVKRDPLSVLRDPLRVRADTKVLIENRLMMRVIAWLEQNPGQFGQFVAEYKSKSLTRHAASVAEALLAGSSVSYPVLMRAWKATPLAHVESVVQKFRRSATVIAYLGTQQIASIRRANSRDLLEVLEECL